MDKKEELALVIQEGKPILDIFVERIRKAEEDLFKHINSDEERFPNCGGDCNCKNRKPYNFIMETGFSFDIFTICLNCGGDIDRY